MTVRTVSATEAKNRFGAVVKSARDDVDVVVVENHGEPYAFILSPSEFQRLQDADNELRRRVRLEHFDEVMRAQAERNRDLSAEEADEMAVRAVREFRTRGFIEVDMETGAPAAIANQSESVLVAISPADYEELQVLRRAKLLREVRKSLNRIQEAQLEMTRDLSDEAADALIEEIMADDQRNHSRFTNAATAS